MRDLEGLQLRLLAVTQRLHHPVLPLQGGQLHLEAALLPDGEVQFSLDPRQGLQLLLVHSGSRKQIVEEVSREREKTADDLK